jgi:eukaryotic-like serine/threonine-protein kinase
MARDVAFALEAFSGTSVSAVGVTALPKARRSWRIAAAMAALVILGVAAGYVLHTGPASASFPEITFDTRTWDAQWITNARFAPDGQTIVYTAAATGNVPELFVIRQGTSIPQPLGQPRTHLLSVSKTGELAVITNATYMNHRLFAGTLTRMTMDGAARPLMEKVREADWSPDGSQLAVIHDLGEKDRLEYPIGKTLYEGGAYLSDPRVSPDGSRVAFLEHPDRYDDRGWLKVVDLQGTVTTLAGEFWGAEGVAWSPDGAMLFFSSAGPAGSGFYPQAVGANGHSTAHAAFPSIASAEVMDIAADGRMLVDLGENRLSMRALVPGETVEREFPWLGIPIAADMSEDGRWLLFSDEGQSAGLNYAVALRKTDGTPAVRLGEGYAIALSPDGKWAIGNVPSPAPGRFVLYPTGLGQTMPLDLSPVVATRYMDWLDNGRVFLCGAEPDQPARCYQKNISGGPPVPVTPAGISRGWTARDGRTILAGNAQGQWQLIDLESKQTRPVPGDHVRDQVFVWSADHRSVFVRPSVAVPLRIERIDLATGTRTPAREIMPADRSGVMLVITSRIVDDGRGYSYSYWRQITKAVVVSGVPMGR